MNRRSVGLSVVACIALLATYGGSLTTVASQTVPTQGGEPQVVPPDIVRVTLLGTGVGPPVNLRQFGASTLVEAAGKRLLFDCGAVRPSASLRRECPSDRSVDCF
jgi:hypothetical protein